MRPLRFAALALPLLACGCVMYDSPTVLNGRRVPGPARPGCPQAQAGVCQPGPYVAAPPIADPILEPARPLPSPGSPPPAPSFTAEPPKQASRNLAAPLS